MKTGVIDPLHASIMHYTKIVEGERFLKLQDPGLYPN